MHATVPSGDNVHTHLGIQKEANLLVDIEDIYDELIILKMVLEDQLKTVRGCNKTLAERSSIGGGDSQVGEASIAENGLIENRLQRIETMQVITRKTTKTVRKHRSSRK